MKFATMSYTFSRQKEHFDLGKMLAWTARHMDGIDFVTLHGCSAGELRKRVDDLGIPVACHTFYARDLPSTDPALRRKGVNDCLRGFEAAALLGAPVVMIPTPGNPETPRREWRQNWIEGLAKVAPRAADFGIVLTVENFPGAQSPFVLADDFLQAHQSVPSLRLTFDNGNAATGEDPVESYRRCAEQVVHVHFKDWQVIEQAREGYRQMLDGRHYAAALIGEGMVDQAACLKALFQAGYTGYINIEYESNKYDSYEATRRGCEYLKKIRDTETSHETKQVNEH